ncbi:hypothetical protein C900_04934 [Fulvivirga imtechensis AK7]|uniref:Uncharacterized protein n=1 Tax=Fulvivirga imtechensis AK7 TaxID=1237149 RepID=L8JKT8_9BACT|nr:hypothetical protein C900_04934 [Fulvivirga imtechensis AK7]
MRLKTVLRFIPLCEKILFLRSFRMTDLTKFKGTIHNLGRYFLPSA